MPKLRTLSGPQVLAIFTEFGFSVVSQRGSHVKIARTARNGHRELLVFPMHSEIDCGTLHAIYRQASRFVPENDLRPKFFTVQI